MGIKKVTTPDGVKLYDTDKHRLAGSIGTGKSKVPTPGSAPTTLGSQAPTAEGADVVYERYQAVAATPTPYRISPSRLADYMNCPLAYRYKTIDKFPEPKHPAPVKGTLVHSVLEKIFDAPPAERTPAKAAAMLPGEWDQMLAENPEYADLMGEDGTDGWLGGAQRLLDTYFRMEDPAAAQPAKREERISVRLNDDVTLIGYIDRVDENAAGEVRITDYKTGPSPRLGFEDKAMFQLKIYALAIQKATGRTPKVLQLMYLGDGHTLRYEPTEAEIRATEVKVRGLWDKIHADIKSGQFQPRQSGLCGYCAFKDKCPKFGGTIPPFPGK